MPLRLYADEHFDVRVCALLRKKGHDVRHVRQDCLNKSGDSISDEDVLKFAISQRRVVLTDNIRHFRRLTGRIKWHHGIVGCHVYKDPKAKAKVIDKALSEATATHGHLVGQWISTPTESATAGKRTPKQKGSGDE
jgi:hypothetical protein